MNVIFFLFKSITNWGRYSFEAYFSKWKLIWKCGKLDLKLGKWKTEIDIFIHLSFHAPKMKKAGPSNEGIQKNGWEGQRGLQEGTQGQTSGLGVVGYLQRSTQRLTINHWCHCHCSFCHCHYYAGRDWNRKERKSKWSGRSILPEDLEPALSEFVSSLGTYLLPFLTSIPL